MNEYNKQLNKCARSVSKQNTNNIINEIYNVYRRNDLPDYEKLHVIDTIYDKLSNFKKNKVRNHFGFSQTTPTTVPPTTIPPTTVPPTTVPPTTVAPTTVAPTTIAPTTVAVAPSAPSTMAPQVSQQVPSTATQTTSGVVVGNQGFNQLASAVQNLEQAAGQLLNTAATQGISG